MGFRRKIKYYLVHGLSFTNKDAAALIQHGRIKLNGQTINTDAVITDSDELSLDEKIIKHKKVYRYFAFNKPAGYESTLNAHVADNLSKFFPPLDGLAIAGRLDKASDGLLILSNDGEWVNGICDPGSLKEKEYLVTIDPKPDQEFINKFENGVLLGTYLTKKCHCEIISHNQVRVILTEGKYRQIRRMCHVLKRKVIALKRIRVHNITLENLKSGAWKEIGIVKD